MKITIKNVLMKYSIKLNTSKYLKNTALTSSNLESTSWIYRDGQGICTQVKVLNALVQWSIVFFVTK